jgi:hypothetical protein
MNDFILTDEAAGMVKNATHFDTWLRMHILIIIVIAVCCTTYQESSMGIIGNREGWMSQYFCVVEHINKLILN